MPDPPNKPDAPEEPMSPQQPESNKNNAIPQPPADGSRHGSIPSDPSLPAALRSMSLSYAEALQAPSPREGPATQHQDDDQTSASDVLREDDAAPSPNDGSVDSFNMGHGDADSDTTSDPAGPPVPDATSSSAVTASSNATSSSVAQDTALNSQADDQNNNDDEFDPPATPSVSRFPSTDMSSDELRRLRREGCSSHYDPRDGSPKDKTESGATDPGESAGRCPRSPFTPSQRRTPKPKPMSTNTTFAPAALSPVQDGSRLLRISSQSPTKEKMEVVGSPHTPRKIDRQQEVVGADLIEDDSPETANMSIGINGPRRVTSQEVEDGKKRVEMPEHEQSPMPPLEDEEEEQH